MCIPHEQFVHKLTRTGNTYTRTKKTVSVLVLRKGVERCFFERGWVHLELGKMILLGIQDGIGSPSWAPRLRFPSLGKNESRILNG